MRRSMLLLGVALISLASAIARADDHPALGVTIADKTNDTAAGVTVADIYCAGPAALAGVKPGDRITAIDKQIVLSYDDVIRVVGKSAAGSSVSLGVTRGTWQGSISVTLGRADQVFRCPMISSTTLAAARAPNVNRQYYRPRQYNFWNRPDLSGPVYIPPPIPPDPIPPPIIVNP